MATAVKKPLPTDVTPSAPVKAVIGEAKGGTDPRRPLRMVWGFISGTFDGTFNTSSKWGRKGAWVGLGIGVLAAISGAGIAMIAAGWLGGLLVGAVAGAGFGALTGGIKGAQRVQRVEDNADQVAARAQVKPARQRAVAQGPDYRDAYRANQQRQNYNIDRVLQVEREQREDSFADRVDSSRGNSQRGF